ncbi:DUF6228 family protein [Streptomyces adustus]|uniref:DUF6228 family protein n=1 Tax=Streptomyces adustus TaxID=1609272 RepID=UPI00308457BC
MGDPGPRPVHLLFSELTRPYDDEPTLDFLIKARGRWVSVETSVRTWDGDGLHSFLSSLAEDFRGWEGARTWHSSEYDLTISAEHQSGGHVQRAGAGRPADRTQPPPRPLAVPPALKHGLEPDPRPLPRTVVCASGGRLRSWRQSALLVVPVRH